MSQAPLHSRRLFQFGLGSILLLVGAVAICLAYFLTPQAWERYRFRRFNDALYASVTPGDSISRVQDALGVGQPADANEIAMYRKVVLSGGYADGFDRTDELVVWHFKLPACSVTTTLQFRGGRLINHNPLLYKDLGEPTLNTVGI